jgi:hypothetical protein
MTNLQPRLFNHAFEDTNRILPTVWKRGWLVFILIAVLLEACHFLLIAWGEFINPDWGLRVADFLAGLLASGTYILVVPVYTKDVVDGRPSTNLFKHSKSHLNQVMIEMLRVVAKVIIGLLLFIIPGIIWSIQLTFVPLIAQFDRAYLEGKVDALRQSEKMVKGHFWSIFILSIIFFLLSALESYKYAFPPTSPVYAGLVAVTLFLEVYVYMYLFSVYERLSKKLTES